MIRPTTDRLNELFDYNRETGVFTRRITVWYNAKAGDVVGHLSGDGYLHCAVDGAKYKLHVLAWKIHYGQWPSDQIDHINLIRTANWISNLRENAAYLAEAKRRYGVFARGAL
jgi:hypothetical protein